MKLFELIMRLSKKIRAANKWKNIFCEKKDWMGIQHVTEKRGAGKR
jgi:hypothetical protein